MAETCPRCNPWGCNNLVMADGHLADCSLRPATSSFPGKMAGKRSKYWCRACDHVAKTIARPACPSCGEPMEDMGDKWRVGKKGKRTGWPGEGEHIPSHGEVLLAHLNGTFELEKTRWRWGWYR